MASRALSELTISFGLVSIPVKMYAATDTKDAVSFNLIHRGCGSRVRQQYFCVKEDIPVSRSDMVKGYEFEKDRYVTFEPDELKMLEEKGTQSIDIVGFVPAESIDPIFYDKGYYLGPAKRGERPYTLLLEGMKKTGRVALARWVSRGKAYTVQVRPIPAGGLVLQQLLYADEIRAFSQIGFEPAEIKPAELELAVSLIEQSSQETFDPAEYEDVVKQRVLAAIEQKVQGKEVTVIEEPEREGGQIIDLMEALRASLAGKRPSAGAASEPPKRKPVKRAASKAPAEAPRKRASKK